LRPSRLTQVAAGPYLRIGELAQRTGVSPALLRAWERRYGVIAPARSEGGFRLYSEEEFLSRPVYTQPEIQRANLAEVILRLKALLLGIMAKHTGQPLEVIERDSDRDYYLEAKGAVEYGLVDQVLEAPVKVG